MNKFNAKSLISLTKLFPLKTEKLFEYFLDPLHFKNWFSPPGFNVISVEIEPIAGGAFKCELEKPDGSLLIIKGNYIKIEEFSEIVFSFMYEPDHSNIGTSRVSVRFEQVESNTEVKLVQEFSSDIPTEGRTKGWVYMFGRIVELLKQK